MLAATLSRVDVNRRRSLRQFISEQRTVAPGDWRASFGSTVLRELRVRLKPIYDSLPETSIAIRMAWRPPNRL